MIKFFRNIRQNLLNEGKTSKYFKYAIGEIVLVLSKIILCPVRDKTWVETKNNALNPRAFRYEIYNVPNGTFNQNQTYLLPI